MEDGLFTNLDQDKTYQYGQISLMVERYGKSSNTLGRTFLKEWRVYRGMTQEQLAEEIQTTHVTISRMERGERPYNQPFLEACAEALDCTPGQIIDGPPIKNHKLDHTINKIKKLDDTQLAKLDTMIDLISE